MKTIYHMTVKDLLLLFRDPVGVFFILGFPICMAVFFGMVMGRTSSGDAKLRVALVDEDQSAFSKKFREHFQASSNIELADVDREQATNSVRRGRLLAMIVIPKGFGASAGILWKPPVSLDLAIDPSRNAEAGMLEGLIMRGMGELIGERFRDPKMAKDALRDFRQQFDKSEDVPPLMKTLVQTMFQSIEKVVDQIDVNPEAASEGVGEQFSGLQLAKLNRVDLVRAKSKQSKLVSKVRSRWDLSFPQATMWGILSCTMGFAISMVREHSNGTYFRLAISPASKAQILIGKSAACFVAVIAVVAILIAIGMGLGMRPRHYDLLVLATFCTAVAFVGVMMLMSVLGKTEEAVSGAGWGINVLMAMFGGGMIPLAFMPPFMKTMSHFSPVKWAILAMEGAIWRDFSYAEMAFPCGILVAIGVTAYGVGLILFSRRVDG